jgi:hypothetical protein
MPEYTFASQSVVSISEMISVLLSHIFDCKIVHYEGESDCPCFVQPESMRVARRLISKRFQTSLQQLVGK